MSLSESLWKENEDLVRAALKHRFVHGSGRVDAVVDAY